MTINLRTVTREDVKNADTKELIETYNLLTGKNIKKFASRQNAEAQVWKQIQQLPPADELNGNTEPKKAAKKQSPGKREDYEHRTIKVLIKENPKRAGSRAHKKFQVLMEHDGRTIKEFKEKENKYSTLEMESGWPATELRWAIKLNLVKIENGSSASKAA